MLTEKQLAARQGKVTASFAPKLMDGDEESIMAEWRRLVGDPSWKEEDFGDSWVIKFGEYVEPFALDWHEKKTHMPLTRRGEVVVHPKRPYVCCTLDAYRESDKTVIDCKTRIAFQKATEVVTYYTPQVYVQKGCLEADKMALLIVHGGAEPREFGIQYDQAFDRELWSRIDHFWSCVENFQAPYAMKKVVAVSSEKEYDMTGKNEWAALAADWIESVTPAKKAAEAEANLKKLVPHDAAICKGHGIKITRDRAGRLSLRNDTK